MDDDTDDIASIGLGYMADARQLRQALAQLVETCRVHYHGSHILEAPLLFAEAALEDTSPAGQVRRMERQQAAHTAARTAECERAGRHLSVRLEADQPPRCDHCGREIW